MSQLILNGVSKSYDGHTDVLNNVSLEVKDGEFLVLVGPSGCGKSTLLRLIAGLEDVTKGSIHLNHRELQGLPPSQRNIAMVFQDYALYPHMTVAENLSFGLRIRQVPTEEILLRIGEVSKILSIDHLLSRRPAQLSGGQRQRVAIGRAIVRKADLFLFDEPLSNLDALLRSQTRIELASLHKKLQTTTVYVTHDQVEAMTLATRIVVLHKGTIQQIGQPLEVYHHPANQFVAGFIGNPSMNFFKGNLGFDGNGKPTFHLDGGGPSIPLDGAPTPKQPGPYTLGVRPEGIKVLAQDGRESQGAINLEVTVVFLEPHGHEIHLIGEFAGQQLVIRSANPKRIHMIEQSTAGSRLPCTLDLRALHWFDPQTQERVTEGN